MRGHVGYPRHVRRYRLLPLLLAGTALLSACGGSGGEETTTTGPAPTQAPPPAQATEGDRQRAASMLLTAQDVAAAAASAFPGGAAPLQLEPTTFTGTADVRRQRQECGVATADDANDRLILTGEHFLIGDPADSKRTYVNSQVILKRDARAVEERIEFLKTSLALSCMENRFNEQVRVERERLGPAGSQLVAQETVERLSLPGLGSRTVAIRVHEQVSMPGVSPLDQYVDILITYVGLHEITVFVESSFEPPSTELDAALIQQARGKAVRATADG